MTENCRKRTLRGEDSVRKLVQNCKEECGSKIGLLLGKKTEQKNLSIPTSC